MTMKRIIIGSDKSGFSLKNAIADYLEKTGWEVTDAGTTDLEHVKPYYVTASLVAERVSKKEFEKGILICGTGMGMAVVANKYEGVYAACCESVYAAEKCRAINDANILTMGGWIIAPELGIEMTDKFLGTAFTEGLEEWRQTFLKGAKEKVREIEKEIYHKKEKD